MTPSSTSQCRGAGVPSKQWSSGPAPSSQERSSALWDILQTPAQANRRSATRVSVCHPSKRSSLSKVVTVGFDTQLRKNEAILQTCAHLICPGEHTLRKEEERVASLSYNSYLHFTDRSHALRDSNSSSVAHRLCDLGRLSLSQGFLIGKIRIKKFDFPGLLEEFSEIIYIRCYHDDWDPEVLNKW